MTQEAGRRVTCGWRRSALDRGDAQAASPWLFQLMRDPATPGLAEAMDRYHALTGSTLLH